MSNEKTDTIASPPPSTTRQDRSEMTDRELLLDLHDRLDEIYKRLAAGDELFKLAERREKQHEYDWTVAMKFMKNLNVRLANFQEADKIEYAIQERFPNGKGNREIPTNPENERPDPDAE